MAKTIEVVERVVIQRPMNEVKAQFFDIAYHATHPVHDGITFTVLERAEGVCRYRQETKVLGVPQVDESTIRFLNDGTLLSETTAGTNAGAQYHFRFESLGPNETEVVSMLTVPLDGPRAMMSGMFKVAAQSALRKASAEDKRDLESGRYAEYRGEK